MLAWTVFSEASHLGFKSVNAFSLCLHRIFSLSVTTFSLLIKIPVILDKGPP